MAKWLKLTRIDGTKELVNMDLCQNVVVNDNGNSVLWFFGDNSDTNIEVRETLYELSQVLGAVGKE